MTPSAPNLPKKPLALGARALMAAQMPGEVTEVADKTGVSRQSVLRARRVMDKGGPAIKAAIWEGRLKLFPAERLVELPAEEQEAALEQHFKALAAARVKQAAHPRENPWRMHRPLKWRMERAIDQLDNAVSLLETFLSEPQARGADKAQWLGAMSRHRDALTDLIRFAKQGRIERGDHNERGDETLES
jgi:hypothetical protein